MGGLLFLILAAVLARCGESQGQQTGSSAVSSPPAPSGCLPSTGGEHFYADRFECKSFVSAGCSAPGRDLFWDGFSPLLVDFGRMNGSLAIVVRMPLRRAQRPRVSWRRRHHPRFRGHDRIRGRLFRFGSRSPGMDEDPHRVAHCVLPGKRVSGAHQRYRSDRFQGHAHLLVPHPCEPVAKSIKPSCGFWHGPGPACLSDEPLRVGQGGVVLGAAEHQYLRKERFWIVGIGLVVFIAVVIEDSGPVGLFPNDCFDCPLDIHCKIAATQIAACPADSDLKFGLRKPLIAGSEHPSVLGQCL